jgi:hypothetical protein
VAQTYTAYALGISFGTNKDMYCLFNGAGSGRVVRLYRMWMTNASGTGTITGTFNMLEMRGLSALTGGTAAPMTKHNPTSETPPAQILSVANGTETFSNGGLDVYNRFGFSADETASGDSITSDTWELQFPTMEIFTAGYQSPDCQPLTLREGQGICLFNLNGAVGNADIYATFTLEAT